MNKFLGDVRDIFFNNIKKKFLKNKKFYILTNDADVLSLKLLRENKRFIDAGVAEQNLINIAAGIAKNNNMPIVYGFCTFLTFRSYEQLRFNIASHKLNVKIVGIGPGYSFSYDGPTHHGAQDSYLMYLIPEFEIINISDNKLAYLISENLEKIKGPTYIRIDKGKLEYNLNVNYDIDKGFEIIHNSKYKQILIITTGYFCKLANEVSNDFQNVSVLNFFKYKNFNKKFFLNTIKKYKKIVIYDESSKYGGITPIIANFFIENKLNIDLEVLSSKDVQSFFYSQERYDVLKKMKICKEKLKKLLKKL
jgi:transketolase